MCRPRCLFASDLITYFEQLADAMESGEMEVEREWDVDGTPLEHLED